jgi:hypothetical protein
MAVYSGTLTKALRSAQESEAKRDAAGYSETDHRRFGKESEERFFKIFEEAYYYYRLPLWFKRIERTSRQEDQDGVDFYAITMEGLRIPIDVKNSIRALRKTSEKLRKRGIDRSHVVFIVVNIHELDKIVYETALRQILQKRNELLAKRAATE